MDIVDRTDITPNTTRGAAMADLAARRNAEMRNEGPGYFGDNATPVVDRATGATLGQRSAFGSPVDDGGGPVTSYRLPTTAPDNGVFQSPFVTQEVAGPPRTLAGPEMTGPEPPGLLERIKNMFSGTPKEAGIAVSPGPRLFGSDHTEGRGFTPGALTTAAAAAPNPNYLADNTISGGGRSTTYTPEQLAALPQGDPTALARVKADYGAMKAQERTDTQDQLARRDAGIRENIAFAEANDPRRQFDANVRNPTVGQRVFGGPTIRGINAEQQGEFARAGRAGVPPGGFLGAGAPPAPRNYFEEYGKTQEASNAAGRNAQTGQLNTLDLAGKQLDVAGRKRLNDLGSKLTAATDPKEIATLHAQMLSLLGKDKPEEYQIAHLQGGQRIDPLTNLAVKDPDTLAVINKRTGRVEQQHSIAAPTANGAKPPPPADAIAHLRKNPSMKADFDVKYGAGSAARYVQ